MNDFYKDLDSIRARGRGSCCTTWTLLLLLAGILGIGIVLILMLR